MFANKENPKGIPGRSIFLLYLPCSKQIPHRGALSFDRLTMASSTTTSSESLSPPLSVSVEVAHQLLAQEGFKYLDVRTPEEYIGGHVEGAINIPYLLKGENGMEKNPTFLEDVSKKFSTDEKIIVGCQSGRRSLMAAKEMVALDFTGVKDMAGGWLAWVQNGYATSSL